MGRKQWVEPFTDKDLAMQIAEDCNIDPHVALILVNRGISDSLAVDEFLSGEFYFEDPFVMAGMQEAVQRITAAIDSGERIAVYGDYDCDGITATALLFSYLQDRGATAIFYIPDRLGEGYGMNLDSVNFLHEQEVKLIITVDNGISAACEIARCNELGIDVVVTDHHLPPGELPAAIAVVDPYRADCPSEFKALAGVGVAYKLVCALENCLPEELLNQYADLVAMGTLADIMPLVSENRCLVQAGLRLMNRRPRLGLLSLLKQAGLEGKTLKSDRLSFSVNPRINAAGRMGASQRALRLLLCQNEEEADSIAAEINDENNRRHEIEQDIIEQCVAYIEENDLMYDRVLIAVGENLHHGVLGIVASRIVERFGRPAIVCSIDGDEVTGSGRSLEGFPLFDAITEASGLLIRFGGHKLAAGVTLSLNNLEAFKIVVQDFAHTHYTVMPRPKIKLDCKLRLPAINLQLAQEIEKMQPFGHGNPNPVIGLYQLTIREITELASGKHLRITFFREGKSLQAMLFGCKKADCPYVSGDPVDAAVTIEPNQYNGMVSVTTVIKALRPRIADEQRLAESIALYEQFRRQEWPAADMVSEHTPSREEIGTVYRFIRTAGGFYYTPDLLYFRLKESVSYVKMRLALDVLGELGIVSVTESGDRFSVILSEQNARVNLDDSELLTRLRRTGGDEA